MANYTDKSEKELQELLEELIESNETLETLLPDDDIQLEIDANNKSIKEINAMLASDNTLDDDEEEEERPMQTQGIDSDALESEEEEYTPMQTPNFEEELDAMEDAGLLEKDKKEPGLSVEELKTKINPDLLFKSGGQVKGYPKKTTVRKFFNWYAGRNWDKDTQTANTMFIDDSHAQDDGSDGLNNLSKLRNKQYKDIVLNIQETPGGYEYEFKLDGKKYYIDAMDVYGIGGVLGGALVGGYVGYKIGRARPQKTGFDTEKEIIRKAKKTKWSKDKGITYAKGGRLQDLVWNIKDTSKLYIPTTFTEEEIDKEIQYFNDKNNEWYIIEDFEKTDDGKNWTLYAYNPEESYAKGGIVWKKNIGDDGWSPTMENESAYDNEGGYVSESGNWKIYREGRFYEREDGYENFKRDGDWLVYGMNEDGQVEDWKGEFDTLSDAKKYVERWIEINPEDYAKGGVTEKDKLDEAIKHFEDKIKKQGRITNARDEEQLSRLKELRKSFAKGGALEKEFKFDKNFVIYVPSTSDVGNKISKKELEKRVKEVEKYVANEFGGYTETDTDGGYKATSGEIIEEDIVKVSVFANNKDWKENESKVVSKVKEWANKWGQEAIGFEYEGDLYYIDDEGKFAKGGKTEKGYLVRLYAGSYQFKDSSEGNIYLRTLVDAMEYAKKEMRKQRNYRSSTDKMWAVIKGGGEDIRITEDDVKDYYAKGGKTKTKQDFVNKWEEERRNYYEYWDMDELQREYFDLHDFVKPSSKLTADELVDLLIKKQKPYWEKAPKFEIKEEIDIIRKDSGAESNAEEDDDYYEEHPDWQYETNPDWLYAKGGSLTKKVPVEFEVRNRDFERWGEDILTYSTDGRNYGGKSYNEGFTPVNMEIYTKDLPKLIDFIKHRKITQELSNVETGENYYFDKMFNIKETMGLPGSSIRFMEKGGELDDYDKPIEYLLDEREELSSKIERLHGRSEGLSLDEQREMENRISEIDTILEERGEGENYAKGGKTPTEYFEIYEIDDFNKKYILEKGTIQEVRNAFNEHYIDNKEDYLDYGGYESEKEMFDNETKLKEFLSNPIRFYQNNTDGTEIYRDWKIRKISGVSGYAKGGETEYENTDLISGSQALDLYASEEIFTAEQDLRIDQAIDGQDLETDEILHDFREWALYNQKDWFEEDEEISGNDRALEVFRDFNEYYNNGLTHRQNWTAFLEYAQDELPKYRKGGVLLYKDPSSSYTVVIDDSVFEMNEGTLNYSVNTYIGERSEYPEDISHWGEQISLKDAPIVIKDKIKERENTSYKKGGVTKKTFDSAVEWNNATEKMRKDILSSSSCSPNYCSYSYTLLNPDTKEKVNIYFETNKEKLELSPEERDAQITILEQALKELGGKDRELEGEIKKLKNK